MNPKDEPNLAVSNAPLFNENGIEGYDMVAAVTQRALNSQFFLLWGILDEKHRTINWSSKMEDEETGVEIDYSFEGTMKPPFVKLGTSEAPNFQVMLYINIPSGKLIFGSSKKKEVELKNWKYVFDVGINFVEIEKEKIEHNEAIPVVVKEVLHNFDSGQFTIRHLLMNFQDANIANYNSVESDFPRPVGQLTDDQWKMVQMFVNTILVEYFKNLAKTDHPYILGYSIEDKSPKEDIGATFNPTNGAYWIFPEFTNQPSSTLNFLLETGNNKLPYPTNPKFETNLVTGKEYNGKFVVARKVFFDRFLLPQITHALRNKVDGYGNGKHVAYRDDGVIDWRNISTPHEGIPHWAYNFDSFQSLTGETYDSGTHRETTFDIYENGWFNVDLENQGGSTAIINLVGAFDGKLETSYKVAASWVKTWAIVHVDWIGKITLEGGTDGIIKLKPEINTKEPTVEVDGNFLGRINLAHAHDYANYFIGWAMKFADSFIQDLNNLKAAINTNSRFVLPAGSVFLFKNPQFDSHQNLLMDLTYNTECPDGTLVRADGYPEIYIVQNGKRCWIPDMFTLNAKYPSKEVIMVSHSDLIDMPIGPQITASK
jgi:hypothetical protein